jgi:hypothetical protein
MTPAELLAQLDALLERASRLRDQAQEGSALATYIGEIGAFIAAGPLLRLAARRAGVAERAQMAGFVEAIGAGLDLAEMEAAQRGGTSAVLN